MKQFLGCCSLSAVAKHYFSWQALAQAVFAFSRAHSSSQILRELLVSPASAYYWHLRLSLLLCGREFVTKPNTCHLSRVKYHLPCCCMHPVSAFVAATTTINCMLPPNPRFFPPLSTCWYLYARVRTRFMPVFARPPSSVDAIFIVSGLFATGSVEPRVKMDNLLFRFESPSSYVKAVAACPGPRVGKRG